MTAKHEKKTKSLSKLPVILASIFVILTGIYIVVAMSYQAKFLPGTKVYGVDVSNLTSEKAEKKLKKDLQNTTFILKDKRKVISQIDGNQLGIQNDFVPLLQSKLSEQNPWLFKKCAEIQSTSKTVHAAFDNNVVDNFIEGLFPKINTGRVVTQNAKIINTNGQFSIQPEVIGNNFNKDDLKMLVSKSIQSGTKMIRLDKNYVKPTVTKNDKKLNELKNQMQKMSQVKATYTFAGQTIQIPNKDIASWLEVANEQVKFNDTKVYGYINGLNAKYATLGRTRAFKSTKRGVVNVSGGIYGWQINVDSEVPQLKALIQKGEDFTREPTISGSGYHKDGTDIGNTYVEVDKVNQQMYVYSAGKQVISTPIVTGKPGQDTPVGVFRVWAKQRNATLRGLNDDGTKYASPVSYWMPIDNTGVGIHDSPWQPKYGGKLWLTVGSHGCINTPPATMAKLFNIVATGTPVIVF